MPTIVPSDGTTKIGSRSKLWDGQVVVSAANPAEASDLRCEVWEALIAFLQREYPHALPKRRAEVTLVPVDGLTRLRADPTEQRERSQAP